jgi:hypothetical protein
MNTKGYLPHQTVKSLVFWILSFCIAVATVAEILEVWGVISDQVAGHCLWTSWILGLGSVAFLIVNYLFGDLGGLLFGPASPPPGLDPAFSDRLRKAKVDSAQGELSSRRDEPMR